MKFLTSLVVLSSLASCGPAQEIKKRAPLFTTEEKLVVLSEKADQDIVLMKYKNSIKLKCDFMIDNRADSNITGFSGAGFTVNLAASESPSNLVFKMNNGQVFTAGVQVKSFDITDKTLKRENGDTIILRQSPVVELVVRGRDVQGRRDKRYQKKITLYENISETITDLFPKEYPHFLKCELQTVIPEKYQEDYQIVTPVKEVAPEEINPETVVTPSPDVVSETNPTTEETEPNP